MTYRLGNQVVLVMGEKRAAFYDLHRCRLERVPVVIADMVGPAGWLDIPREALATPVVSRLIERRFIVERDSFEESYRISYEAGSGFPRIPYLHTVAVELGDSPLRSLGWAALAITSGVKCVTIFSGSYGSDEVDSLIRTSELQSSGASLRAIEVIAGSPDNWKTSQIYNGFGHLIARRRRIYGHSAFHAKLRVDENLFSLLRQASELSGHAFIDANGGLWPHWKEDTECFGHIHDLTPAELIQNERFEAVSMNIKDRREKCMGCELRYACVHPFSDRIDPADIRSRPLSCSYDPLSAESQSGLFEI